MKKIIFLLIAIASVSYVDGQAVKSKIRIYQTWVYTDTASRPVKGALYFVSDSSIIIGQSLSKSDYIDGSTTFSEFKYSDIESIKYRKKGDIIVGSAVGIAVGILTTAIIWNKPVSDPGTPPAILLFEQAAYLQATLILGAIFAPVSMIIGAFIGGNREEVIINGEISNLNGHRLLLKELAIAE